MRKYWAELLGTFVLVFGGCGTAVLAGDKVGFLGVALAFGLSLLAMVYVIGPISGCHVNPAVTLGMFLSRKIRGKDALAYVGAQLVGAVIGAGFVYLIARGMPGGYDPSVAGLAANGYGAHSPGGFDLLSGFTAEVILTFFLVVTVLGATDVKTPAGFAGIPIGLVLTLIHLIGIPVTNTSVNPARSFGPAVFVGGWALNQLWLFVLAPVIGAALAVAAYQTIKASLFVISTREAETVSEHDRIGRELRR
jgi:aquaporin Z